MLLEAMGLGHSFGDRELFRGVDLRVHRGDFMCVLGPNGGGKSTLLRLLTGWLRPRAGRVSAGGLPPGAPAAELARRLAFVPGETHTPFDFTVEETVLLGRLARAGFWRSYSAADHAAADAALRETGLERLRGRLVNTLSSGERQLAFIAQALAQEAPLLLLDEPTSHLDLRCQARVLDLLAGLARRGFGVLAVLHDPRQARLYCGRALLLAPGGAHRLGPAADLLRPEALAGLYGLPPGSPLLL